MASFNTLPYEVILNTLDYLDSDKEIKACQLSCRNWNKPTQELIFKDVRFTNLANCKTFIKAMQESPNSPDDLVKTIEFVLGHKKVWDVESILTDLAKCCPNVEVISGTSPGVSMWEKLLQDRLDGHWQNVRQLPIAKEELIEVFALVIKL